MNSILIKQEETDFIPNSKLDEVVVFIDRAQVTRRQSVSLERGETVIAFTNLADSIDEQTIKASISSDGATITSTSHVSNMLYYFREKENEKCYREILKLLKAVIALLDAKTISAMENAVMNDLRAYLQSTLNEIILEQEVSIVKLREALSTIEEGLYTNNTEILTTNRDLASMQEKLNLEMERLKKIRELDKRRQNNILVTIEAEDAVETDVTISYIVPGITWKTEYDISLHTESNKVDLVYYASIKQITGEDWMEANIILSTSQVERSMEIPDIYPVYLSGIEQKRDRELTVERSVRKELQEMDLDTSEGEPEPEPADEDVSVVKKGVSQVFVIPKPYSIPADGNFHRLEIATIDMKPELYYETVPEIMQYVYLKGSFTNSSTLPLLPGRVSVFRNGSYMGRTRLAYTAVGEPFAVSFGIDEDLKVSRYCAISRHEPAKGLSSKNRREWEFHYSLYNYKSDVETVRLKEAIYLSELKEVTVSVGEQTTPGFEKDIDGIITWNVRVEPDPFVQKKIILNYTVVSQKSFDLSGL
jgi:uncharacterized protein (TIGR02231 family)